MSHWPQWHSVGTFGACRGLILSPPSSSPASPVQGKVEGSSSTFSTFSSYQRPPMIRLIIQCRLSTSSSPSCFASASPLLVAYNPFYLRMAATSFVLCALRLRCAFSAAGVLRLNGCLRVLCLNVCFNVGVTIDLQSDASQCQVTWVRNNICMNDASFNTGMRSLYTILRPVGV